MEPLGEFLKEIRTQKRLSIEKVIEDTHILKKFIIGIEADDFTVFPGEAYLKGFLRNYSEYLGLESNEIIRRFEKIKLSETPSPIEQLIPKPGFDYSRIIFALVILIAISLLGSGMFFIYNMITTSNQTAQKVVVKKEKTLPQSEIVEKMLILDKDEMVFDLKKDQKIGVTIDDVINTVWLSNLDPTVVINSSSGKEQFLIGNGYTNKFDMNGDGKDDVEIVLNFWDSKIAKLLIRKSVTVFVNESSIDSKYFIDDSVEVLYEGADKLPLDMTITISDDTFLRYQIDGGDEKEAKYSKGNSFNLNVENQIIVWVSNAGALNISLNKLGKKFVLGEPGQMDVKIIAWTKNGDINSLQISSLK
ncbi:MAG: hypothetical protein A2015_11185 [Spirochaetes bacterium GWF1_31_7]|nr:MAG: hypothetical protein A2Y30_02420 [Spirochaetes bacterium GWE1_32_154]OHD47763.1 MAG: hypothetical protein A2015_11185 [Spirochaetes bacterium GWF1_31_7]OHD50633.1 MAG: hypothetical protein A2Y29_17260 [Spirochaetes bacterium GWE2_31_10]OHD81223.1 MAG: hypothetical protein A2355_02135 [Spirochaetes bacterium RIFOXYB1_FULL_32_8]HBD95615.1 hypothetical protein [Spirochaetia bacterium]